MAKLIDLTGQRFDKIIVIKKAPSRKRHVYWSCQCDCGNICEISGQSLRNPKIKFHNCGCVKQNQKKQKETLKKQKENWLIGKRFGKLLVLQNLQKTASDKSRTWKCLCDCGNICQASTQSLTSGHKQSCGCLKNKHNIIDITNQKFGKLTALKIDQSTKGTGTHLKWICQCDCGNIVSIDSYNLRNKITQSCGCITSSIGENNIKEILNKNNIFFKSEYTQPSLNKKRFDFAIIKNKKIIRLIEFDGQQHYSEKKGIWNSKQSLQSIQKRDKQKNRWAKEHNIPLVRIPYWERNNITLDMILGSKYLINDRSDLRRQI